MALQTEPKLKLPKKSGLKLPKKSGGLILPSSPKEPEVYTDAMDIQSKVVDENPLFIQPKPQEPDKSGFTKNISYGAQKTFKHDLPSSLMYEKVAELRNRDKTLDWLKNAKKETARRNAGGDYDINASLADVSGIDEAKAEELKLNIDKTVEEKEKVNKSIANLRKLVESKGVVKLGGEEGGTQQLNQDEILSELGVLTDKRNELETTEEEQNKAWNEYMSPILERSSGIAKVLTEEAQKIQKEGEGKYGNKITLSTEDVNDLGSAIDYFGAQVGLASGYMPMTLTTGGLGMIGIEQGSIEGEIVNTLMEKNDMTAYELFSSGMDQQGAEIALEEGLKAGLLEMAGEVITLALPWTKLGLKAGTKIAKSDFFKLLLKSFNTTGKILTAGVGEAITEGEQTRIELAANLKAQGFSDDEIKEKITDADLFESRIAGFTAGIGLSGGSTIVKGVKDKLISSEMEISTAEANTQLKDMAEVSDAAPLSQVAEEKTAELESTVDQNVNEINEETTEVQAEEVQETTDKMDEVETGTPVAETESKVSVETIGGRTVSEVGAEEYSNAMNVALDKRGDDAAQVYRLTKDEAQEIIDGGGKLFLEKNGEFGAYVKGDGYMGGLFKDPSSTEEQVAKQLQDLRIKHGGTHFDAYGVNADTKKGATLEGKYIRNGWVPVSRVEFNEEYVDDNYASNEVLNEKPDVVFFKYDPQAAKDAKIGDGKFVETYDEGIASVNGGDAIQETPETKLDNLVKSKDLEKTEKGYKVLTKEGGVALKEIVEAEKARIAEKQKQIKATVEALKPSEGISDTKISKAKDKLAGGLEMLARVSGVTKNIAPVEGDSLSTAIKEIGDSLIDLGIATVENVAQKVKDFIKENGYSIDTKEVDAVYVKKEKKPAGGGRTVKKTVVNRAYEGGFREEVKKQLEKIGLEREQNKLTDLREEGQRIVDTIGAETAIEAVRNGDVNENAQLHTLGLAIDDIDNQLSALEDNEESAEEYMRLSRVMADAVLLIDKIGEGAGLKVRSIRDIYEITGLEWNLERQVKAYEDEFGTIPDDVRKKFEQAEKEIKELKGKIAALEQQQEREQGNEAIQSIIRDIEKGLNPKQKHQKAKQVIAKIKDVRSKIKANAYSDATGIVAIVDTGLAVIETAIEQGIKISDAIEAGVNYIKGKLREQGVQTWEKEEKFRNDMATALMEDIRSRSKKDGKVKAEIKEGGKLSIPDSIIRGYVEMGYNNIEDLVSVIKEDLLKDNPDAIFTDRQIRDAITGYGRTLSLNKEEIATQIRKMKRVGRLISALEDVRQKKKRPLRSGLQRDKLDAEERKLHVELREAMKDLPLDEETQANQQRTQLDNAKARIRNKIEELELEISTKEKIKRSPKALKEDAELISLKKKRDDLKKERDKLFNEEDELEAKRLERIKENTNKRAREYARRLNEKDYSPMTKKKSPVVADDELTRLKAKEFAWKELYEKEREKRRMEERTTNQKIKDSLWDFWGLTRALQATGEWSFVLRQAFTQTISHPKHAAQAFKEGFRFMTSERHTNGWLNRLRVQPFYQELKEAKLSITEPRADMTAAEEAAYSGWTNMIWDAITFPYRKFSGMSSEETRAWNPMRGVERAMTGYMDTMRVLRYLDGKNMLENRGIYFKDNPQAYKEMADVINTLTGRASLGKAEMVAEPLTKIFYSPRMWMSQFKLASPYAFYYLGTKRAGAEGFKPSVAQKVAIRDLSVSIGTTLSFVMMAAAYFNNDDDDETGVEFDPRSSDFMKIKIGDRRIDPWGGMIQEVVLWSRLISGAMKKGDEIVPLGEPFRTPTRRELFIQRSLNKLNPSTSLLSELAASRVNSEGKRITQFGDEFDWGQEIKERTQPMFWSTTKEILEEDGVQALDGLLIAFAFLGGGVDSYPQISEDKVKKEMDRRKESKTNKRGERKERPSKEEEILKKVENEKKEEVLKQYSKKFGIQYIAPKSERDSR